MWGWVVGGGGGVCGEEVAVWGLHYYGCLWVHSVPLLANLLFFQSRCFSFLNRLK